MTDHPVPYLVAEAVSSEWQRDVLRAVRDLRLPDCWVAAGLADIDVLFYLDAPDDAYSEQAYEAQLKAALPQHNWQVRNRARMHHINGFPPFRSSAQAMCHWVETPTAVGLALDRMDRLRINAPLGVADLTGLRVQPGPRFRTGLLPVYRARILEKGWPRQWPKLRVLGM